MMQKRSDTQTRRQRQTQGFSILEVLVAVVLIAVGILAAVSMQASSLRVTAAARQVQQMNAALRDTAEQFRGQSSLLKKCATGLDSSNGIALTCTATPCKLTTAAGVYTETCSGVTFAAADFYKVNLKAALVGRDLVVETKIRRVD